MMKKLATILTLISLLTPMMASAATKFLEPGGDADFAVGTTNGFWFAITAGAPAVVTDFVHGNHVKSIQFRANAAADQVRTASGVMADAGRRVSFYLYVKARPNATANITTICDSGDVNNILALKQTSAGVLQMFTNSTQIGTNGPTLTTGTWHRISIAYTITSTTVNRIEVFVDGTSAISITNATLAASGTSFWRVGNSNGNTAYDSRISDEYIDDSTSLTDTGDIWVTAKRPFSNGTSVQYTTQVGAGGSGYGSGHTPQVNERPISATNAWSIQNAAKQTEEYTIESASAGDIDLTNATIVDWEAWVSEKVGVNSTGNIIANGVATNISVTTADKLFTKIVGTASYPAGNTDVGVDTNTVNQLFTLEEAGVLVAYNPVAPSVSTQSASSVTQTTATLNGTIDHTGGSAPTVRGFAWGTVSTLSGGDTATTTENGTFADGAFTNTTNTYVCNTTYYSRAYATNPTGTGYGAISASFTTSACPTGFMNGLKWLIRWIW